jgi:hypothetical protein
MMQPTHNDHRTTGQLVDVRSCGSCWAFAGTTVLSWRLYLKSKGTFPTHSPVPLGLAH